MTNEPTRRLDRLVGACFSVLLGALALYGAVWLVGEVWVPLLVIVGVGLVAVAAVLVLRGRARGGW